MRFPFRQWARVTDDPSKDLPDADAAELAEGLALILATRLPGKLKASTPEAALGIRLGEEIGVRILAGKKPPPPAPAVPAAPPTDDDGQ